MANTRKDELLRKALTLGKVSAGSVAHQMIADTYDTNPQRAEQIVEALHPSEVAAATNAHVVDVMARGPASEAYDTSWLTGIERQTIANAQAGLPPRSHFYD